MVNNKLMNMDSNASPRSRPGRRHGCADVLDRHAGGVIKLRQATRKDCRLIWQWANDPDVRSASFSTEPIVYRQHVKWFEAKLKDPDCYYYIAENSRGETLGQIRFDLEKTHALVSISLDRKFRELGHGAGIIALASRTFLASSGVKAIHAYIRKGNTVSLAAFKKAGFSQETSVLVDSQPAHHLILSREQ